MYTISEAADRAGVSVDVLRAWERRYGVVTPQRTATGYRLYDVATINTIRAMRQLVKEGWSLVDTATLTVLAVPGREAGQPMAYAEAAEALRHLHQEDPVRARGLKILRLSEVQGATAGPA